MSLSPCLSKEEMLVACIVAYRSSKLSSTCFALCAAAPLARRLVECTSAFTAASPMTRLAEDVIPQDAKDDAVRVEEGVVPCPSTIQPTHTSPHTPTVPLRVQLDEQADTPFSHTSSLLSFPSEAEMSDAEGGYRVCGGFVIARSVTSRRSCSSAPNTAPTAEADAGRLSSAEQLIAVSCHAEAAKMSSETIRALLCASAWWLTRASPNTVHLGRGGSAPVVLSLHGAASLCGLLLTIPAAAAATTTQITTPVLPANMSPLAVLLRERVVSVRFAHVEGDSLQALMASHTPTHSQQEAACSHALTALGEMCHAVTCLEMEACDGWPFAWWSALASTLLPRVSQLSLSDMAVSPCVVPLVQTLLGLPFLWLPSLTSLSSHTPQAPRMATPWCLRVLKLHNICGVTALSAVLLVHLFLSSRSGVHGEADKASTDAVVVDVVERRGLLPCLAHLDIARCDFQPLPIQEEVQRWLQFGRRRGHGDGGGQRHGLTTSVGQPPSPQTTVDALCERVRPHLLELCAAWPGTFFEALPELTTFQLSGVTGLVAASEPGGGGGGDRPTVVVPKEARLKVFTFTNGAMYPLSVLTCVMPSVVRARPTTRRSDTHDASQAGDEPAAAPLAWEERLWYPDTTPMSALPLWHYLLPDVLLSPGGAFSELEALQFDGFLSTGARVVHGVRYAGTRTLWRRTLRAVQPLRHLKKLRRLELTLWHDEQLAISESELGLTLGGRLESSQEAVQGEANAVAELWDLAWLRSSSATLCSLQLVNILPPPPAVADENMENSNHIFAHLLMQFPTLRHFDSRCWAHSPAPATCATRHSSAPKMGCAPLLFAWRHASLTELVLRATAARTPCLQWSGHGDDGEEGAYALSRLPALARLDLCCDLLLPLSASAAPSSVCVDSVAFASLVTLTLDGFTPAHAATLFSVSSYPHLRHVAIYFAPQSVAVVEPCVTATDVPLQDSLTWLARAPAVTHIDLKDCDIDASTLVPRELAGTGKTDLCPSESARDVFDAEGRWWARYLAAALSRPCLRSLCLYRFRYLRHGPPTLVAGARETCPSPVSADIALYECPLAPC